MINIRTPGPWSSGPKVIIDDTADTFGVIQVKDLEPETFYLIGTYYPSNSLYNMMVYHEKDGELTIISVGNYPYNDDRYGAPLKAGDKTKLLVTELRDCKKI